jgi:hypothetical protein
MKSWTKALVATALAGSLGCQPSGFAQIKPSLLIIGSSLNFNDVAVGTTSPAQSIELKAQTSATVTISASIQGDSYGVFAIKPAAPTSVAGNSMASISVVFTPGAAMAYGSPAVLVIKSNDPNPNNALRQIPLTGTGNNPMISVAPTHLGFTAVACPPQASSRRCSDTETVMVTNTGIVTLTLGNVAIVPTDSSTPVPPNLTLTTLVSEMVLVPGQSAPVSVLWAPSGNSTPPETGNFTAILQIPSNDPTQPIVPVSLTANATPATAPSTCINVLSVTERSYTTNSSGTSLSYVAVPSSQWLATPPNPALINVTPGMLITLTSLQVASQGAGMFDAALEQSDPCTADPQGLTLTRSWLLTTAPTDSHASLTPAEDDSTQGANAAIEIDAAGQYDISFQVTDSLGLSAMATFTLNAQPDDDVLAQLNWETPVGTQVDLDIHFLVDSGPSITGPGALFCTQDCFFYNTMPDWFHLGANDIPRFLRDDQGNAAGLSSTESVDLVTAPQYPATTAGSSFRVAAYYYASGTGGSVTPTVTVNHLGTPLGPPITAPQPLQNPGDTWYAAEVTFPPSSATCGTCTTPPCDCPPTLTVLDGGVANVPFPPGIVDGEINQTCSP